jgi:hypothetical protein
VSARLREVAAKVDALVRRFDAIDPKTAKYKLIAKAREGNTTGQIEEQQENMKEWARSIGYKGKFGELPEKKK